MRGKIVGSSVDSDGLGAIIIKVRVDEHGEGHIPVHPAFEPWLDEDGQQMVSCLGDYLTCQSMAVRLNNLDVSVCIDSENRMPVFQILH